jgi:hypothetical protein
MSKYLIFIAVFLFFSLTAKSQQTIDKLNANKLNLPKESVSRALILDSSGQVKSSATVSDTELGYLDGLIESISTSLSGKEPTIAPGTASDYWRGDKTWQPLDKNAVGLGNVDNTSDATKNSASATLTNKTIDADLNTITNIENADIKSGAAIDASKIGDGSVSTTEFQYINSLTSNAQTQIGTKADDSSVVHLTGNESISGIKTFTGRLSTSSTTNSSVPCPVMTDTQRDALTPVKGDCVFNSVTNKLNTYSGSAWEAVGNGSGGGISAWITAKAYIVDDLVIESNKIYKCLVAHTSGTFATDLASVYWVEISAGLTSPVLIAQGGTNSTTALSGSSIIISNGSAIVQGSAGTTSTVLHGNASGAPTYGAVALATETSGILPLANGGTNKNATANNGAIAYSDADSFELLAPGTSGQILQTNGAGAPSFVNKSISAKRENSTAVTAEELQVPNDQLTQTDTNKHLIETGNNNILVNPSFEHSTFSTGWTNSAGTFTAETSLEIHGLKAAKLVLSAQTMSLTQSSTLYAAQFADGVQGLAMVRVKSNVALNVCSIQAGTVSTTNCVAVAPSNTWGLYKIPFVFGATSQGVSIASSGAVTGTVYIDDAFVGAVDLKQDVNNIGPWISFTPTGTWSTNTTYSGRYRQNAENLEIQYFLTTSGAPTTASLNLNIPSGFTINSNGFSDPSVSSNTRLDSSGGILDSGTAVFGTLFTQYLTSTSIQVRSGNSAAQAVTVTQASPMTWASGDSMWLYVTVPVTQFAGSSSVFTKQCNGAECESVFGARVVDSGAAGTVSNENLDWVSGNCTNPSAGTYVCTFNTGVFSLAPNCEATVDDPRTIRVGTVTNTSVTINTYNSTTSSVQDANGFSLMCQKQGVDYENTRKIIGTFSEVVTSPGISKPKTCKYAYGGASATLAVPTECTTGTCVEVYDSCSAGSPPSFNNTGSVLNMTFAAGTWANDSFIDCQCKSWDTTAQTTRNCTILFDTGDDSWKTNSSGGFVAGYILTVDQLGAQGTAYTQLSCVGQAP